MSEDDDRLEQMLIAIEEYGKKHDMDVSDMVVTFKGKRQMTFTAILLASIRAVLPETEVTTHHARAIRELIVNAAFGSPAVLLTAENDLLPMYPVACLTPHGMVFMSQLPVELGGVPAEGDGVAN